MNIAPASNTLVATSGSSVSIVDRVAAMIAALPTNDVVEGRIRLLSKSGTLATAEERWAARVAHAVLCGHGARYTDWSAKLLANLPWNSGFAVPDFMTKSENETRAIRLQVAQTEVWEGAAELVRALRAEAPAMREALDGLTGQPQATA